MILLRCLGCSAAAFAYMWVFQWRHYVGNGRYAHPPTHKDPGSE